MLQMTYGLLSFVYRRRRITAHLSRWFTWPQMPGLMAGLALAAVPLAAGPAASADAPSAMIVLDGSGSMWAKAEGSNTAKIDLVRQRLAPLISAAGEARIGLTAFGQRRRGDCADTELIAALDAPRAAVEDAVAAFNPRGKGPLVAALRRAKAALDAKRPMSVVLIADGADNCQQDACAEASAFAKEHPGVNIHLVAIGVGPIHKARLECLPAATGGKYIEARTEDEIGAAIDEAAALAGLRPGRAPVASAPSPEAPPDVAPAQTGLKAVLVLADGKPPVNVQARWRIRHTETGATLAESEGPSLTARLDPGTFDIEASAGDLRVTTTQTLQAGRSTTLALPLNAARLKARTLAKAGELPSQTALITIEPEAATADFAAGSKVRLSHGGEVEALLPPGTYAVTSIDGPVRATRTVTLALGSDEAVDLNLDTGRLQVSAVISDGAEPLDNVTFVITTDDPDRPTGRREVARSRAPNPIFTLAAGTYYVEARSGSVAQSQRIAVSAGETHREDIVLPLVAARIGALIGGKPPEPDHVLYYRLLAITADGEQEIGRYLSSDVDMTLLPGRYRAEVRLAADHIRGEKIFSIDPGSAAALTIDVAAGRVALEAAGQGQAATDYQWEIHDTKGVPVWRSAKASPTALLPPGQYTVTLATRSRLLQAAIKVENGDNQTVRIGEN
jgi:Ca-activated chloride channel homolog